MHYQYARCRFFSFIASPEISTAAVANPLASPSPFRSSHLLSNPTAYTAWKQYGYNMTALSAFLAVYYSETAAGTSGWQLHDCAPPAAVLCAAVRMCLTALVPTRHHTVYHLCTNGADVAGLIWPECKHRVAACRHSSGHAIPRLPGRCSVPRGCHHQSARWHQPCCGSSMAGQCHQIQPELLGIRASQS